MRRSSMPAAAPRLDFIERQGDGLNSTVGERGRMLSGGERQRLSIARALLKNAPVLVMERHAQGLPCVIVH